MRDALEPERLAADSLDLAYFLVPWDSEILGYPVAAIEHIQVRDAGAARLAFNRFRHWCAERKIVLCSCRIPQADMAAIAFLEGQGFRFVELNLRPALDHLQSITLEDDHAIDMVPATDADRDVLAGIAATTFKHGRFHDDPRIGPEAGNRRYRTWLLNGFSRPEQHILKCLIDGRPGGFFLYERPAPRTVFWSLIGLADNLKGQGYGKRVWRQVLKLHQNQGVDQVTTSISSHNLPVLNLYAALDFRFFAPTVTLHWIQNQT